MSLPTIPTPAKHHRFHLLDGLRGLAALLIIFWHLPPLLISRVWQNTYLTVDFFFCLSGFVIAFSYEKRLLEGLGFNSFFKARLIRLYPTFLLGMLLGLVLFIPVQFDLILHLWKHFLPFAFWQLLMLPNLHLWPDGFLFPFNPVAWSLFLEMLANLVYADLVRYRLARTWLLSLAVLLPAGLIGYWAHRGHSLDIGFGNDPDSLLLGFARVTMSFSMGVLLLRLYRRMPQGTASLKGWSFAALPPCALVAMFLSPLHSMHTPVFHVLTIIVFLPALVFFGSFVSVPRPLVPLCVFLGDISYPIYMLHLPFLRFLEWKPINDIVAQHILAGWLLIPVFFGSMVALAYFVYHHYDVPVRQRLLAWQRS